MSQNGLTPGFEVILLSLIPGKGSILTRAHKSSQFYRLSGIAKKVDWPLFGGFRVRGGCLGAAMPTAISDFDISLLKPHVFDLK